MVFKAPVAAVLKNFGAYQDHALREPVIIIQYGRPHTVLMAYEDYARLSKLDRCVDLTADLRQEDIAAVEHAKMEVGLEYLDSELTLREHHEDLEALGAALALGEESGIAEDFDSVQFRKHMRKKRAER